MPGPRLGPLAALGRWLVWGGPGSSEAFRGLLFGRQNGLLPAWHVNPVSGVEFPRDQHWSTISDFGRGDVKIVWEASRFGFAYDLVRAYWRTGDERYPERFWSLTESWLAGNKPDCGPNWKCGQETSLRVMAWLFALHGFRDCAATTPERAVSLIRAIAFSGARVEATLDYAINQQNNHGVSEGVGLWTIGLLFPEFRAAHRWRRLGRRTIERLARELVYGDGGFAQHSVTYHRVMLDALLWAIRLGDANGEPLADHVYERASLAGEWLRALMDPESGLAPNWGANDGARILPLSSTRYRDMRPTVQAARWLTRGNRALDAGAWDEAALWLSGKAIQSSEVPEHPAPVQLDASGLRVLPSPQGRAIFRVGSTFKHRPGHADLLHLDVWWRGENVALDAGTFSYNAPAPFEKGLGGTAFHNTVVVDGKDQMDKSGRFLWLPWASAGVTYASSEGEVSWVEASHDGYTRLDPPVQHRRAVAQLASDTLVVIDEVFGTSMPASLHWLLADAPYTVGRAADVEIVDLSFGSGTYRVACAALAGARATATIARAESASTRGWQSTAYWRKDPAISLHLDVAETPSQLRFVSVLGPVGFSVKLGENHVEVARETETIAVHLGAGSQDPLIAGVDQR